MALAHLDNESANNSAPCVVFEDDHLLVVNKPAGLNTHAPAPLAPHGLYEWLRHREERWANLALLHRLDKETSGVILFSKSELGSRELTAQFAQRRVKKTYLLLTEQKVEPRKFRVTSCLVRVGSRYQSRPPISGGAEAVTLFEVAGNEQGHTRMLAQPLTGRSHQIRAQAAESGFPILGDALYGGAPGPRLCLHALELAFAHPATGARVCFSAPADFSEPRWKLREAFIGQAETTAFRLCHGAGDGWPGLYLDRTGDFLLAQSEGKLSPTEFGWLRQWQSRFGSIGIYHKRKGPSGAATETSAARVGGSNAPREFFVLENGCRFSIRFGEGCSIGLFLDQRENRRRLLTGYVGPGFSLKTHSGGEPFEVLNAFAYTCGFSICAALAGARVTSLDLSKKYLDWGRDNFRLNNLAPERHDFIYGDVFEWLRRLDRKNRRFQLIILDPPTFSRSKTGGVFRVEKDYADLIEAALPLLVRGGVALACSNCAGQSAAGFLEQIERGAKFARRKIQRQIFIPQPPDFPPHPSEPAYLKTVWLRIE